MNCRDSESLILAERDGALTKAQDAALSGHVAACPSCQRLRADLATALAAFKADIAAVPAPDADAAWRDLQARLHETARPAKKRPLAPVIWFGGPLAAAAAALALMFFSGRTPPASIPPPPPPPPAVATAAPVRDANADAILAEVARAEYVEAGDVNASTMVYVDKESGWLVVWATDADDAGITRG
jgi:anti-sigma factor RsiW